jgi:hypothetical protein
MKVTRKISLAQLSPTLPSCPWSKAPRLAWSKTTWIVPKPGYSFHRIMVFLFEQLKIFWSIIGFVAVEMVNTFIYSKGSVKELFHDMPMLVNITSVYPYTHISIFPKDATALPGIMRITCFCKTSAALRTVFCGIGTIRKYLKLGKTMFTFFCDLHFRPSLCESCVTLG